jgi:putative endopeptidase
MARLRRLALLLGLLAGGALGGGREAVAAPATAPPVAAAAVASGLDLAALDRGASPCDDFFAYACGGWLSSHPVPADESVWSRSKELALRIEGELRAILEQDGREPAARGGGPVKGGGAPATGGAPQEASGAEQQRLAGEEQRLAEEQARLAGEPENRISEQQTVASAQQRLAEEQERLAAERRQVADAGPPQRAEERQALGDDYASCMDEAAIEAQGLRPLAPQLERIAALRSLAALPSLVAELHRAGVPALFSFAAISDPWHAGTTVALVNEGGLGLPERGDYLRDDAAAVEERRLYGAYLARVFGLLGDDPARAAGEAAGALAIETGLAWGSFDAAAGRQPEGLYQRMSRADLAALTPDFDWNSYFGTLGAPPMTTLAVGERGFFRALGAVAAPAGSLDNLKSYLRWQVAHAWTDLLPRAFAEASFDFFGRSLEGAGQIEPRWRRCVAAAGADLGGPLARAWADQAIDKGARERAADLVGAVQRALASDLTTLAWLSEPTKRQALLKIRAVHAAIGAPAAEGGAAGPRIVRGDALGNRQRAAAFDLDRQVARIGQAPDPSSWPLAPAAVEAFYDPLRNALDLPAGLLQPPLFAPRRDAAANFGALGCGIGRSLALALGDPARRFDAAGQLHEWWSPADLAELERRASCFAGEYSAAANGPAADGALFVDQSVAETAGVRVAYLAFHAEVAGRPGMPLDGFSAEQRFFLAFAQSQCGAATPTAARRLLQSGLAAPPSWQVNGALSELPEFARAWSCKAGAPMVRKTACRLW